MKREPNTMVIKIGLSEESLKNINTWADEIVQAAERLKQLSNSPPEIELTATGDD